MKRVNFCLIVLNFAWLAHGAPDALPLRERVKGVAFDAKHFVVVGEKGGVYITENLQNWTFHLPGSTVTWTGVAYGHGTFVASGIAPGIGIQAGVIASSNDGVRWTERQRLDEEALFQVIFANERFVAMGDNGRLLSSTNGIDWEQSATGMRLPLRAAAFGKGLYMVAGGKPSEPVLLTSFDLKNWTPQQIGARQAIWGLAYGDGVFVATPGYDSFSNQSTLLTSEDGITWQTRSLGVREGIISVAYGNGRFVAAGDRGTILSSVDAIGWNRVPSGVGEHFVAVTYVGSHFMAIWDQADRRGVVESVDGSTWNVVQFNADGRPRFKLSAFSQRDKGLGMFIGPQGARRLVLETSTNLRDWTIRQEIRVPDDRPLWIADYAPYATQRFYRLRMVWP